jgi:trans-4-hydroxy-L-proline dehydratase
MEASVTDARQPDPSILSGLREHLAAGFFELPDASPMLRWSRAMRRFLERRALPPYRGEALYPCGPQRDAAECRVLVPSFSFTWEYADARVDELTQGASGAEAAALEALRARMRDLESRLDKIHTPHTVGGKGYTHSIPNYGRVLREGLDAHAGRIREGLARAGTGVAAGAAVGTPGTAAGATPGPGAADFYAGLDDLMAGVNAWIDRIRERLASSPQDDAGGERNRARLMAAYGQVPRKPARSFFEALVAYSFTFYLDGCDNPGRFDLELSPFYEADLLRGAVTHEEAVGLVRQFWSDVDVNAGWSTGIGGTGLDGSAAYTDLTLACLEAARGRRRPNLQLHVRRDMPEELWEEAFATLATGCGLPALYNDELYTAMLRSSGLGVREEDLAWRNGGGCTETMIHGRSNVGSLDAGLNLPLVLDGTLRARLSGARSFDDLLEAFLADAAEAAAGIAREVNADQEAKAALRPQPVRSLLVDDCIRAGREFNAGGARYNWSVVNVAGLANAIDSLAALREVVFERAELSGAELAGILAADFKGREDVRARLARCPRFGNDDPRADDLASTVSRRVFAEISRHRAWRGGFFMPSCLMFVTYARAGQAVGALPDGRRAGEPLADSAGPYQGRDTHGPTAMLRSVARLAQDMAPGTLVVNLRFLPRLLATAENREKVRDLVRTYFSLGGMQLQVNVVDQGVLRDALAHPERHADLVVRVGGYSEYFNRLDRGVQESLLLRTAHGAG